MTETNGNNPQIKLLAHIKLGCNIKLTFDTEGYNQYLENPAGWLTDVIGDYINSSNLGRHIDLEVTNTEVGKQTITL